MDMWYRCNFSKQVLLLEERSPFFVGGKNPKLYNGAYGFFQLAQTPTCAKKDQGNCYIFVYSGGQFNGQVLVWAGPSPNFFRGEKNENFTMAPMGTFCFVFLILRNPPMEIGEIIRDICRTMGSHYRTSWSWEDPPQFLQGAKKTQFPAKFSTTFGTGGLLI